MTHKKIEMNKNIYITLYAISKQPLKNNVCIIPELSLFSHSISLENTTQYWVTQLDLFSSAAIRNTIADKRPSLLDKLAFTEYENTQVEATISLQYLEIPEINSTWN